MKDQLDILYTGSLDPFSNSFRRYRTLEMLGHQTIGIDTDHFILGSLFTKIHYHLNIGPGIHSLNNQIIKTIKGHSIDLLLVDNKSYITKRTLTKIKSISPKTKIVNIITDDPGIGNKRSWRLALETAAFFDMHFVQRVPNIAELKSYGAKDVALCFRSYDPHFHRPIKLSPEENKVFHAAVGFIGTYEEDRESFIAYLIKNGIPVRVVGDSWAKGKYWNLVQPFYGGPSIYGEDYIRNINGMDIALHFLRKANRDEQDSRTFEIPACGKFMLAERSPLHTQFFVENEEAVFFDSKEDLLEKVKYYLLHEDERNRIAYNGMQRCKSSGYDHESRLKKVIDTIFR